jgi:hypothetical protein
VLRDFAEKQRIPYPLLSDVDSQVIQSYRILNTEVERDDAFLFGIPFPGVYVADEQGVVVAKFFHDSYKKRDSPELLIDAALGRVTIDAEAPRASAGDDDVKLTVALHGGKGSLRQGIRREIVARFELADGLHIYGAPVPEGLVPTTVEVAGPPGLVIEDPITPPTERLHLESLDVDLEVWSGQVDIRIPVYPVGELASETRPLDTDATHVQVTVRYQACNDDSCLLPRTEKLSLEIPLDVIDVPGLGMHTGHGQREGENWNRHLLRLMLRKVARRPLGLPRFVWKSLKLERAARRRGAPR